VKSIQSDIAEPPIQSCELDQYILFPDLLDDGASFPCLVAIHRSGIFLHPVEHKSNLAHAPVDCRRDVSAHRLSVAMNKSEKAADPDRIAFASDMHPRNMV
jgi:hypothetical protein